MLTMRIINFIIITQVPNRPLAIYKANAINNTSSKVWQKIVNNFEEDDYVVERTFNEVRDGTMVPATIVYKADIKS